MTSNPEQPVSPVILGKIGRVHGIKGWVRLHSFTDPAHNIENYGPFTVTLAGSPRLLELEELTDQGRALIARFRGYDSPEQSRELTGLELVVAASALPALPAGEYYRHQLEGLRVRNLAGEWLGRVTGILETGANDVLQVQACEGSVDRKDRLIPWRQEAVVKAVSLEDGVITVDWGADYLV